MFREDELCEQIGSEVVSGELKGLLRRTRQAFTPAVPVVDAAFGVSVKSKVALSFPTSRRVTTCSSRSAHATSCHGRPPRFGTLIVRAGEN